jgi:hypothetical protein
VVPFLIKNYMTELNKTRGDDNTKRRSHTIKHRKENACRLLKTYIDFFLGHGSNEAYILLAYALEKSLDTS